MTVTAAVFYNLNFKPLEFEGGRKTENCCDERLRQRGDLMLPVYSK
jgi:hypothetical protein